MRDRRRDTRTSSTRSSRTGRVLPAVLVLLAAPLLLSQGALAEVYVPGNEYLGYFDSGGTYTVVGNVKNENSFAVVPTVTVSVLDGAQVFSKTVRHVPVAAGDEVPFKVRFPEVRGGSPVLQDAGLESVRTGHVPAPLRVLYDDTLVKHGDGHLTGRVQNTGDRTVHFPVVYAVVHGPDSPLDVVQNIGLIEKIEPGQIVGFSMYPDPAVAGDVSYYSCFAPVDTTVIPVTAKKNGGQFDFRYDSGAWFYAAEFDEEGTSMTMRGYNSYPLETYANFEFAPISGSEEFFVTVDDRPVEFIQSMDEMGFWHVAFPVEPTSQGVLRISGFESGLPPGLPQVPQWVKTGAGWWSAGTIPDSEFLEGIDFLLEKGLIIAQQRAAVGEADREIPQWAKHISGWWSEDRISDEAFVNAMAYLIDTGIVRI